MSNGIVIPENLQAKLNTVDVIQHIFQQTAFGMHGLADVLSKACAPIISASDAKCTIVASLGTGPGRALAINHWVTSHPELCGPPTQSAIELAVHCADALRRLRNALGDRDGGMIERVLAGDVIVMDDDSDPGVDREQIDREEYT